jgi:hypothetical protein
VQQQQQQQAVVRDGATAGSSGVNVVAIGLQLGQDLAGCWLGVLKAAADVDLAMAQLGVHASM